MKLKNRGILVFLAAMLLMTGVSRAAASFTVARVEVEEPDSGKITHTVTGSGMVDNMKEQAVYAAADVLVAEVSVKQGQNVSRGDVLARLDSDSLRDKTDSLSSEIEMMRLQNMELAAAKQKEAQDKNRAKTRAGEDYESTVAEGRRKMEEAKENVKTAKARVKEAKKQAKKQSENDYKKKQEELQAAVKTAEKAYEDAKEQEEDAVLAAKRAVEDAAKTPAVSYEDEILQMEINEKQRELNELYKRKKEGEEGLDNQIRALEKELRTLRLQQQEKENTRKKQEEERKQTLARAQEDYSRTVKKYAKLVKEAKEKLDTANVDLKKFLEGETEDFSGNEAVKAAEEALTDAEKALEEARRQTGEEKRQAKRNLEDASSGNPESRQEEMNRIQMTEKQKQLAMLEAAEKNGGKITAQMDGTVTRIQLETGQRTGESAAFLMSCTSGGMSFTTEISREDAVYVTAGDTVTLKTAEKKYEELSVVSVETDGEETGEEAVKVTVFVPKDTLSLGEYADMELTKESAEYSVTLPLSAIHTENEKNFVYVMVPEETVLGGQYAAQRMDVIVAEKNAIYAALTDSDLTEESQVIISSDQIISAGEKVRNEEN